MNNKNYFVTSDDGRKYKIQDINNFFKHLTDFHTENDHGNNSLHEENGFYFTVTEDFYNAVKKMFIS